MQNHMTLLPDRVDHVNGASTATVGGCECGYEYEHFLLIIIMTIIIILYPVEVM